MSVLCDYCGKPARLVTGNVIYPHRSDLFTKLFYQCAPCDAYVGCHPKARPDGTGGMGGGTVPMGRLANAELRRAKQAAHAAFDPLWKSRTMTRKEAYAWLAKAMGVSRGNAHIGMFNAEQCRAVVEAVHTRSKP